MSDAVIENFKILARYNLVANARLYEACAKLPDAERKQRRAAFFGSIHGTLNHLIMGDRIWLARFSGKEVPSTSLDAIVYEDFDELREAREAEDARIEEFTACIDEVFLDGTIRYINNEGEHYEDPAPSCYCTSSTTRPTIEAKSTTCSPRPRCRRRSLNLHRVIRPEPTAYPGPTTVRR